MDLKDKTALGEPSVIEHDEALDIIFCQLLEVKALG